MEQSCSSGQTLEALSARKIYACGELVTLGSLVSMTAAGTQGAPEDPGDPQPLELLP